jgi:hypothetical protein
VFVGNKHPLLSQRSLDLEETKHSGKQVTSRMVTMPAILQQINSREVQLYLPEARSGFKDKQREATTYKRKKTELTPHETMWHRERGKSLNSYINTRTLYVRQSKKLLNK